MVKRAALLVSVLLAVRASELPNEDLPNRAKARPVMRRHHSGSARVATISHTAVIAPDAALTEGREHTEDTEDKVEPKQRRLEVREQGIFSPDILVDFSTDGIRNEQSVQSLTFQNEQSVHISFCARLWLGFCLSTIGSLITYLYLQAQRGQEVAPEESLPPRPGTISASVQILCITSLSISYGAMISSMTIFVLPKEAEHFFPKQSSISLGFLELLGAVSLLSGPVAGQVSDRIKHPMGRRRPMVLLCSQLAVVGTIGCWLSSTSYSSPICFSVCLLLQQIAWNCAHAAHNALLSDIIHPTCTGLASSLQTINVLAGGLLGMLSFQGLAQTGLHHTYIYAIQVGLTYLFLPVTHFSAQEAASHTMLLPSNPVSLRTIFWMSHSKCTDYILVLWERGFYYASAASKSFLLYFARDMLSITSDKDQALLRAEASLSTVGAAILGGVLSSVLFTRTFIRSQSIACCGSILLAIGTQFWVCLFFKELEVKKMILLLFFAVYGFGKGSYMSADLALGIATMPDPDEASRYMGLWGLSAFLGAGLGGFVMSVILELFGDILPVSYGMKVKPGSYCIHGYIALLCMCLCCQLYVAHLCLRIRTRAEHDSMKFGSGTVQRKSKTNAFLVESTGAPREKEAWQSAMPEETSHADG